MKKRSLLAVFLSLCFVFIINNSVGIDATGQAIDVSDNSVADWKGIQEFQDAIGETLGSGPNDLEHIAVTSDDFNLYCRWDVLLTGQATIIRSASYSLAINSVPPSGTLRPTVEARAYVAFDSKGVGKAFISNGSITRELTGGIFVQQVSAGVTVKHVSVEAKFPFSNFSGMTTRTLSSSSLFPLWGEALQSGSFNSNITDTAPDTGFLSYNAATKVSTPIGTGPIAKMVFSVVNYNVQPSSPVYYTLTTTNVGDSTGTPNLLFNSIKVVLPTGFSYANNSSSGITTANPTISGSEITWSGLTGSLSPGASTTISFRATSAASAGTYFVDGILYSTTPIRTYETGDTCPVNIDAKYVIPGTPTNLTASGTTQTSTNLSWTAGTNNSIYDVYDNGILIAEGVATTSFSVTNLTPGSTHLYTVKARSVWDVVSSASNSLSVTTVAPYVNTINNLDTDDTTPTITGTSTAPNGTNITVTISGANYTATVNNNTWSITVTSELPDNTYSVSASLVGVVGNTANGTVSIDTRSSNANLSNLVVGGTGISPTFNSNTLSYTAAVSSSTSSTTITPTAEDLDASITINGQAVASGSAKTVSLAEGNNSFSIVVTAEDGTIKTYNLTIFRNIAVTGVSLDQETVMMYTSETNTLIATVSPTNAENKSVVWSSSDETVATVDQSGKVTAVSEGQTVITVTTVDGNKTDTCTVTVKPSTATVSITDGNKLKINVRGWNENYKYQIWTYQSVTSDIFLYDTNNVKVNQWILSSQYIEATAAVQEEDGSISFSIDMPSETPDGNYTVSIKIQDQNGNYIGELSDTYTPESIGVVMISNVVIDGFKTKSNETKEIKNNATVSMTINAINANSYSLKINGENTFPQSPSNTFLWNIQSYQPGDYTLVFNARNSATGSSFSKTVYFKLYSRNPNITYGVINDLELTETVVSNKKAIRIKPRTVNSYYFYYKICEPGRAPIVTSGLLSPESTYDQTFDVKRIGVYDVFGYVKKSSSDKYDDGIVKRVVNPREGGVLSLDVTVNNNNVGTYTTTKGTPVSFDATAVIGSLTSEQLQYSYWRYDAKGWVLIKDWSNAKALSWTPARAGSYSIQVRAKGYDAGSYEISKSVNVNVSTEEIAQDISISINEAYLNENAEARIPIVVNAVATAANGEPLLYKFYISDEFLGTTQIQQYSPIQSCEWTPRKAGTYTVTVLVKNEASFGKYDAMRKFTIIVQ